MTAATRRGLLLVAAALPLASALRAAAPLPGRAAVAASRARAPLAQAGGAPADPALLDSIIAQLRAATEEEMPKVLTDNFKSIDQRLFLRLAEMSDAETDEYEQLRIRQLASSVTLMLEAIIKQADAQMSVDAEAVQGALKVLAEPNGEFELPIAPARVAALRAALREQLGSLDEGFVATVKAYMRRATDDGLDGMVDVLRVLLQTFAAERLRALAGAQLEAAEGVQGALAAALDATPEEWDGVLRAQLAADACGADELLGAMQDKMGEVVLGLPSGSAVQSVLAEYLNELIGVARAIAAEE